MAQLPYRPFPAITVNDAQPFNDKVTHLLDVIAGLPLGHNMLQEIQASRKSVGIAPFRAADNGNKCVAHNPRKFVRLRQAFDGLNPEVTLKTDLDDALTRAESAGQSRIFVCKQVIRGLTPATVRTVNNLAHPARGASVAARMAETDQVWSMAQFLEKLTKGELKAADVPARRPGEHGLADNLLRVLRPWLRPGEGSNSGIYLNPDGQVSCVGERGMAWRPPGIGVAHELCHAWRNATGNRLFDDAQACGLDDDEVMTTGIPPYSAEVYTENKFRAFWPLTSWEKWRHWVTELPMRSSYR